MEASDLMCLDEALRTVHRVVESSVLRDSLELMAASGALGSIASQSLATLTNIE